MKHTWTTLICAWVLSSACSDALYIMHEEYLLEDEGERYVGGSCEEVRDGLKSGTGVGGEAPDYALTMFGSDESVRIVVRDQSGDTLEERTYNDNFLRSGDSDSFAVRRDGVEFLRLKFWGGPTCEPPRDPD